MRHTPSEQSRFGTRGFTLLELIVALAVLSVAVTVFVQLFNASLGLGRSAQDHSVAGELARGQLEAIIRAPEQFLWQVPASPGEAAFPILASAEDPPAGNSFDAPAVLPPAVQPPVTASKEPAQGLYERFRWRAFGRFAGTNPAYCEVTVVVIWEARGRRQMFSLTSAAPVSMAELAAPQGEAG